MATSTILARLEHRSHFFEHRRRRRRLLPSSLSLLLFPLKGFFYLRTDFSASLPLSPLADPLASLGRCGASRPQALEAIPRHRGESFGIPLAGHFILAPPCGREPFYLHLARTHTHTHVRSSFSLFLFLLSFTFSLSRPRILGSQGPGSLASSFSFVSHHPWIYSSCFSFSLDSASTPRASSLSLPLRRLVSFVRGRCSTTMLVCLHGTRWWPCCGARRECKRYVGTVPRSLVDVAGPALDRTKF